MKCPKKEELAHYLDGELPERSGLALREHLLACPECRSRLESLRKEDSLLRGYLSSPLTPGPDCPDEETILACAEDRLTNREERRRIAAHLAGCAYCAERTAGALETIRLRDELAEEEPAPVPSRLARRVRKSFGAAKPVSLGHIVAVLADLRERIHRSFEYGLPAPALSAVMEPSAAYETGRRRAEETPPPDGTAPEVKTLSGRIAIEIGPSGGGKAELRVSLTDEHDRPRPGVELRLQRGKDSSRTRKTSPRGEAEFPELTAGRYRLLIPHREGVFLDLIIE